MGLEVISVKQGRKESYVFICIVSNFLTAVIQLKCTIHKNIKLWLFCAISTYDCFLARLLIIKDNEISFYGCINKNEQVRAAFAALFFAKIWQVATKWRQSAEKYCHHSS
ncbi:hypothetical protein AB3A53_000711 [Vibrio vulnificus]